MRPQSLISCLFIGDPAHDEWVSIVRWLTDCAHLSIFPCASSAIAAAAALPPIRLIVVAQSHPGQIGGDQIEVLHQSWPLARLIAVLGSWCEGERRTGRPWPGVWRVPAIDGRSRLQTILATDESPLWRLPRLATDAERFECEARLPVVPQSGSQPVLVASRSRTGFDSLSDLVRGIGLEPHWLPIREPLPRDERSDLPPVAAVWDAATGDHREWNQIHHCAAAVRPAAVLVLLGFVRNTDVAVATGISRTIYGRDDRLIVLAKPYHASQVQRELLGATGTIGAFGSRIVCDQTGREPSSNGRPHPELVPYMAPPSRTG